MVCVASTDPFVILICSCRFLLVRVSGAQIDMTKLLFIHVLIGFLLLGNHEIDLNIFCQILGYASRQPLSLGHEMVPVASITLPSIALLWMYIVLPWTSLWKDGRNDQGVELREILAILIVGLMADESRTESQAKPPPKLLLVRFIKFP